MRLPVAFLAVVPMAWLVPNHYLPWLSAWSDAFTLAALAAAMLCALSGGHLSAVWTAFLALAGGAVVVQAATGLIHYAGDAWMVLLYLLAFGAAIVAGGWLAGTDEAKVEGLLEWPPLNSVAVGVLVSAAVSVGIACVQWTSAWDLGIWVADLPFGGRPFGNVGQPNHLCTLSFFGLCALGLLHERRVIGAFGFWPMACWLLFGMVMSGSRTGWLQIGFLVAAMLFMKRRDTAALSRQGLGALAGLFCFGVLTWPALNASLLLAAERGADAMQSGTRPLHWGAMLAAIAERPLWGYGWSQVSVAQLQVAIGRPHVGEHIEHSHNLILDLLVWNGLPIGLTLVLLASFWFAAKFWNCRNTRTAWLLVGTCGFVLHAMLEFPLEYAYFLVPLGLLIGAVDRSMPSSSAFAIGVLPIRLAGGLLACMLLLTASDYVKAEQANRMLRLESARIGVRGIETPPPKLRVLTQLSAFLSFAQTEARPNMTADELDAMRRASERFAYPPSLFRYATALGLNGRPGDADKALKRLCLIHSLVYCRQAQEGWLAAQNKWPVLNSIPGPTLPYAAGNSPEPP